MLFYRRATSFAPFNDFLFDPQVFYLNRLALPHLEGLHVALFSHLKSVQLIELSAFVDFDFDNKSALDFLVFLEVMQRYKDSFDLFVLRIQNGVKFLGQVVDSQQRIIQIRVSKFNSLDEPFAVNPNENKASLSVQKSVQKGQQKLVFRPLEDLLRAWNEKHVCHV